MASKRFGKVLRMSVLAAALLSAAPVSAELSYSSVFTAPLTGGYRGSGTYFAIGDQASQSFAAPWLTEVNSLELTLNLLGPRPWDSNNLKKELEFSFELNGVNVGTTRYWPNSVPGQWEARNLDFDFATLFNAAGNWTLRMVVSDAATPCNGCGDRKSVV